MKSLLKLIKVKIIRNKEHHSFLKCYVWKENGQGAVSEVQLSRPS